MKPVLTLVIAMAIIALAAGGWWLYAAHSSGAVPDPSAKAKSHSIPVTEVRAVKQDVPIWLTGLGTVQPLASVVVRPRVDGQLDSVLFTEGQDVHHGQVLAHIDARPYAAQLAQAVALRDKDQAQLLIVQKDLERYRQLVANGAAATGNVDTLTGQVASFTASLSADQAAMDLAQLQVEFSTITAPIDGRVGLRAIDAGAIVHASDSAGIATVTQMEPIAVTFTLPQDDLPDVRSAMSAPTAPQVKVLSRDGSHALADGSLAALDSLIDPANGNLRLKATCANTDRALWPGAFVSARLLVRTMHDAIAIPTQAIERNQSGSYVFTIGDDDTAAMKPIEVGGVSDGLTVITKGVEAGDRVVIAGQYRLKQGSHVEGHPATAP